MKAAVTVWDGRVSPVLDVSREVELLTIEQGRVTRRARESIASATASCKVARLMALGVEPLICGAVSEPLQQELAAQGIRVLGFVAGELEEVIAAFLAQRLPRPSLAMPGCCPSRTCARRGSAGSKREAARRGGVERGPSRPAPAPREQERLQRQAEQLRAELARIEAQRDGTKEP